MLQPRRSAQQSQSRQTEKCRQARRILEVNAIDVGQAGAIIVAAEARQSKLVACPAARGRTRRPDGRVAGTQFSIAKLLELKILNEDFKIHRLCGDGNRASQGMCQ